MRFAFWVLGFGFCVLGSGRLSYRRKENLLGFGFWILGFGFWILDLGFWVLDFGFWILGFRPIRSLPVRAPVRGKGPLKGRRSRNGPTLRKNGLFWSTAHKRKFPPNSGKVPPRSFPSAFLYKGVSRKKPPRKGSSRKKPPRK